MIIMIAELAIAKKPFENLNPSLQTVLLTGATGGIGSAIKRRLTGNYNLITPSRQEMDLSDITSVRVFIDDYKDAPLDIIINNAAINPPVAFEDITLDLLQRTITVNQIAPLFLVQGLSSHMKERKWGRIVNLSSVWGVVGREGRMPYSMTKFALNSMTRTMARELGKYNILVNSVCPGFVDTEMTRRNLSPKQINELLKRVPLGRLAQPDEIANAIAYLISKDNTFYTGQTFVIDGGFTA